MTSGCSRAYARRQRLEERPPQQPQAPAVKTADLTDSEDDSAEVMANKARAALMGAPGRNIYVDMPTAVANAPTPCPLCPTQNPVMFTARTVMAQHLERVHHYGAVFTPLRRNFELALCPNCGVAKASAGGLRKHINSALCIETATRLAARKQMEETLVPVAPLFLYGRQLTLVNVFKYLGVQISSTDGELNAVAYNRSRGMKAWCAIRAGLQASGLSTTNKRAITSVVVYASVLYGCETWAIDGHMARSLRSMQTALLRVATRLKPIVSQGMLRAPSLELLLERARATDIITMLRRRRLVFACKLLSDPHTLVYPSLRRHLEADYKPGKGDAMRPDWLRQVLFDASLCGLDLLNLPALSQCVQCVEACDFAEPRFQ